MAISQTSTLQAYEFVAGKLVSPTNSAYYTIQCPPVTFYPTNGSFNNATTVTLTSTGSGAIWYSLNGGANWSNVAGPSAAIGLDGIGNGSGAIQAYATHTGWNASATNDSGTFAFTVATPTLTYTWGTDHTSVTVSAATATTGATVTYTTDGSQPTSGGSQVPPTVTSTNTTVKAGAFKSGYANSAVASTNFAAAATPGFSPGGGTYSSATNVTVSTTETGATLKYQLNNGGWVSTNGATVAVSITNTATLQAYVVAPGKLVSPTNSATYIIHIPPVVAFTNYYGSSATNVYQDGVALQATASSGQSTITNVAFYDGANLLGKGSNNVIPGEWVFNWQTAAAGIHTITALAQDSGGNSNSVFESVTVSSGYNSYTAVPFGLTNGTGAVWNYWYCPAKGDPAGTNKSSLTWQLLDWDGAPFGYMTTVHPGYGTQILQGAWFGATSACDCLLAFTAPSSGTVRVATTFECATAAGPTRTVYFRLLKNSAATQLYPASDWLSLVCLASTNGYSAPPVPCVVSTPVAAGDTLYLQQNAGTGDATTWPWLGGGLSVIYDSTSYSAPTVSITNPVNNAVYPTPGPIKVGVTASDSNSGGSIISVQVFDNGAFVTNLTAAPYTTSLTLSNGPNQIQAVAYDNFGKQATTAVSVCCGQARVLTTQPVSQTVLPGATVTFSVAATGTAPLTYQWRFNGTNLSGATTNTFTTNNVQASAAGNYAVLVTDCCGSTSSTNATLIVDFPPVVAFTNYYGSSATNVYQDGVALQATASSGQSTITNVAFYDGANLLGKGSNNVIPGEWVFNWQTAAAGIHTITALAQDSGGNSNSVFESVTVSSGYNSYTAVPFGLTNGTGAVWNYWYCPAKGDPAGTNKSSLTWQLLDWDGAPFGYMTTVHPGYGTQILQGTWFAASYACDCLLAFTAPSSGTVRVATTFECATAAGPTRTVYFRLLKNSAATQLYPASDWLSLVCLASTNGYSAPPVPCVVSTPVAAGDTLYLQQNAGTGDGTTWPWLGGALSVIYDSTNYSAPTVSITNPVNNAVYPTPGPIQVGVTASDSNSGGSIIGVQVFNNGAFLTNLTAAPYTTSLTLSNGANQLQAVAYDNFGKQASTAVTVYCGQAPTIVTAPTSQTVLQGSNVTFSVTATRDPAPELPVVVQRGALVRGELQHAASGQRADASNWDLLRQRLERRRHRGQCRRNPESG